MFRKAAIVLRDLWIYFKTGHGGYLAYGLSIFNFIVIQQRLLIENIPFLNQYINNLSSFIIIFGIIYFPTAVVIGFLEYRKGEVMRRPMLNPYTQDMLNMQIGMNKGLIQLSNGNNDEAKKIFEDNLIIMNRWLYKADLESS